MAMKTGNLYLDLETIPTQDPEIRAKIAEDVSPPASMKKEETIAKWWQETAPDLINEKIGKTALDGAYGHICAIGWAVDDGKIKTDLIDDIGKEADMLNRFLEASQPEGMLLDVVIHNSEFDLRFILHRAIILDVPLPKWFPKQIVPWADNVFCTMNRWAGRNGFVKLSIIANALGIPIDDEIDGSEVNEMWNNRKKKGMLTKVRKHVYSDIDLLRKIHQRMVAVGVR